MNGVSGMPTAGQTPDATAQAGFGTDLYRVLAEGADELVFSPLSVAAVLGMALAGARGTTASELQDVLHVTANDAEAGLAEVLRSVAASGTVTFRAPNTAWVQAGLAASPPEFTSGLREIATVSGVDFAADPDAARVAINQVIAQQTEDKIIGLLQPGTINRLTRLVLASAVYLKAPWADPFAEKDTDDEPFDLTPDGQGSTPDGQGSTPDGQGSTPDGQSLTPAAQSLTVRMMHGTASRAFARADGYQAVLLPIQGHTLTMAVVLPDGPLADLRAQLAGGGLGRLLGEMTQREVTLSMPKFRLESSFGLNPALRKLGVTQAFENTADFSGITTAEPRQR